MFISELAQVFILVYAPASPTIEWSRIGILNTHVGLEIIRRRILWTLWMRMRGNIIPFLN